MESILNDPAQRDALEKALQRDTGKLLHEEKPGFTKELREWAKKYAIEQSDNIDEDDLGKYIQQTNLSWSNSSNAN